MLFKSFWLLLCDLKLLVTIGGEVNCCDIALRKLFGTPILGVVKLALFVFELCKFALFRLGDSFGKVENVRFECALLVDILRACAVLTRAE